MARRMRLSRQGRFAVGFVVILFLAFSALLARALGGAGAERSSVLAVVRAEARGDARAALAEMPPCRKEPACAAVVADTVAKLRRPGEVQILAYDPSVRVALDETIGTGRVAWRVGGSLPIVQCVRARRQGPVDGAGVELLSISPPIGRESACP
jgi:hypothetical protein